MEIYTIGFTKKTAAEFFGALRSAHIERILDVRLNNTSQLAGFTKRTDFPFFLKEICNASYIHEPLLAPTQNILDEYKKKKGSWQNYVTQFLDLMAERLIEDKIDKKLFSVPTALLCSETTPENCHRRLVLEYLKSRWVNFKITHL